MSITGPYQFIAIARMIARSFTEQAIGHPEGEALTEAARAIWRGSRFFRGGGTHVAEQDAVAGKQVRELVEAIKTLSDGQTRMAELLKDIHAEQQQQRAAMVKLAAMIEGKDDRNSRPN